MTIAWNAEIATPDGFVPIRSLGVGDSVLAVDLQPHQYGIPADVYQLRQTFTSYLPQALSTARVLEKRVSYRPDITVFQTWGSHVRVSGTPEQLVLVWGKGWLPLSMVNLRQVLVYYDLRTEKIGSHQVHTIAQVYLDPHDPVAQRKYQDILDYDRPTEVHDLVVTYPHTVLVRSRKREGGLVVRAG